MKSSDIKIITTIKQLSLNGKFIIKEADGKIIGTTCKIDSKENLQNISKLVQKTIKNLTYENYKYNNTFNEVNILKKTEELTKGQPFIEIKCADKIKFLHTSISHSNNFFAVGISERELIGIDIEAQRSFNTNTIKFFFAGKEFIVIKSIIENINNCSLNEAALLLWTIKEAFLKAIGIGFKFGFSSIKILFLDLKTGKIVLSISHKIYKFIGKFFKKVLFYFSFEKDFILAISTIKIHGKTNGFC